MLPFVRAATLYEIIAHCEASGVAGDFVECGVWKGGAVGVMAQANLRHGTQRRTLHLFDSFDDICEPDPLLDGADVIDETLRIVGARQLTGQLKPMKGAYDSVGGHGTEAICRSLLVDRIGYPGELLMFHRGWFQDTVPPFGEEAAAHDRPIAVLRLDGDYYASTKVCLDHLYERVITGGFVIVDDYGAYEGCRRAVHDFFDAHGLKPFLHYTDDICRYWIKS
jgi:O-methyltransferase